MNSLISKQAASALATQPGLDSPAIGGNLKVAVLLLTPACNMQCPFCGADAGFQSMDFDSLKQLLAELRNGGLESVVLGGGEPTLWKGGLRQLASEARKLGLLVQIGSNATLGPFNKDFLHSFDRWVLPLESLPGGAHEQMRPWALESHAHIVLRMMQSLKDEGIEVTLSSVVTRENFEQLLALGGQIQNYQSAGGKLHAWHLYRFLAQGRGGERNGERFATAPGIFEDLGGKLKNRFPSLRIYSRSDMYHSKVVGFFWKDSGRICSVLPGPRALATKNL